MCIWTVIPSPLHNPQIRLQTKGPLSKLNEAWLRPLATAALENIASDVWCPSSYGRRNPKGSRANSGRNTSLKGWNVNERNFWRNYSREQYGDPENSIIKDHSTVGKSNGRRDMTAIMSWILEGEDWLMAFNTSRRDPKRNRKYSPIREHIDLTKIASRIDHRIIGRGRSHEIRPSEKARY